MAFFTALHHLFQTLLSHEGIQDFMIYINMCLYTFETSCKWGKKACGETGLNKKKRKFFEKGILLGRDKSKSKSKNLF